MDDYEKACWIGINMNRKVTPRRFLLLLSAFPDVEEIWKASREKLSRVEGFSDAAEEFCENRDKEKLKRELREIEELGAEVVTLNEDRYPEQLRPLEYPPPVLYILGDYRSDDQLSLAVVGTRKCSTYGEVVAHRIGKELVDLGLTVVSGMANGIDTHAHRAALEGGGRTLAVLGTGLKKIYPKNNLSLMESIVDDGAVISEFPLHQGPERWTFPQRNRIISGLSRGTLVVEAGEQSGALITARCALEQGREVYAIPGDVRRETCRGNHALIKDGAKLVETAEDVLEELEDCQAALPLGEGSSDSSEGLNLSPDQRRVYEKLDYQPQHFNELLEETGFPTARLSHIIFRLQVENLVDQVEGNRWVKLD